MLPFVALCERLQCVVGGMQCSDGAVPREGMRGIGEVEYPRGMHE